MFRSIASVLAVLLIALGTTSVNAADIGVEVTFGGDEAATIRAYYQQTRSPGQKNKRNRSLPPGIAKNLERGKSLPPGIAKQVLPQDLVSQLPPVRDGYERVIVDGKVLLVEVATQVIHDVLSDIILN